MFPEWVAELTGISTYNDLIESWLKLNKNISLLISLRPPTNYYSLKKIIHNRNIQIRFLGNKFHSKFIIFENTEIPLNSIIGSSNFTNGGLDQNIETNILVKDEGFSKDLKRHFIKLWNESFCLEPSDLEKYKIIYDMFISSKPDKDADEFEKEIIKNRNPVNRRPKKIILEARQYRVFWQIVDQIREYVSDIAEHEYPGIPVYLVIDHFWHWVKIHWRKGNEELKNPDKEIIRDMFQEYCKWDKAGENYVKIILTKSNDVFKAYLSENNIDHLTLENSKRIYENMHSGEARSNRFSSNEKFINMNKIENIIKSLKYLLYSGDDIEIKIHNMSENEELNLHELGMSGIQELIGWVYPEKYPMRNDKADAAVHMLGYRI
jgi:hypothetical protein